MSTNFIRIRELLGLNKYKYLIINLVFEIRTSGMPIIYMKYK